MRFPILREDLYLQGKVDFQCAFLIMSEAGFSCQYSNVAFAQPMLHAKATPETVFRYSPGQW